MPRYTDGRPEEEFLLRAHEREARQDAGDLEDEPTAEILVDGEDVGADGLVDPERDDRIPPWWNLRRHSVGSARIVVGTVLGIFLLTAAFVGLYTLIAGEPPPYQDHQPTPQALPGAEDIAEPGEGSEF